MALTLLDKEAKEGTMTFQRLVLVAVIAGIWISFAIAWAV